MTFQCPPNRFKIQPYLFLASSQLLLLPSLRFTKKKTTTLNKSNVRFRKRITCHVTFQCPYNCLNFNVTCSLCRLNYFYVHLNALQRENSDFKQIKCLFLEANNLSRDKFKYFLLGGKGYGKRLCIKLLCYFSRCFLLTPRLFTCFTLSSEDLSSLVALLD